MDEFLNKWHPLRDWDLLPDTAGVYEIKNLQTAMSYVGSAISLRRRAHYKILTSSKSHNQRLQRAFKKYGETAFVFRVIEYCHGEDPVAAEQNRIDERDFSTLYNVAPIAGSTLGYKFTDDQVEMVSKIRKGVRLPYEVRKNNWLKNVERQWKEKIYRKLLSEFKKTDLYQALLSDIKQYLSSCPWLNTPIVVYQIQNRKRIILGNSFSSWWLMRGGMEYADNKYHFLNWAWRYMPSSTHCTLLSRRWNNDLGTFDKTVKLIADRIMNEQLSPRVEQEYPTHVVTGKVNLDYDKFHKEPINLPDIFRTEQITAYDDGTIRSLSKSKGDIYLFQEWYSDGAPKIALIENLFSKTVEKRLWYRNGAPECLINFKEGVLHGILIKWADDNRLVHSVIYDHGNVSFDCHHSQLPDCPEMMPVLERPSKGTACGVSIIFFGGEEDSQK